MFDYEQNFLEFLAEELGLYVETPRARVAEAAVLEARSKLKRAIREVEASTTVEAVNQAAIQVSLAATSLNDKKLRLLGLLLTER